MDGEKVTQKHNKAGGCPIFAGSVPPLQPSDLVCRVCRGLLSLVVQVCQSFDPAKPETVARAAYSCDLLYKGKQPKIGDYCMYFQVNIPQRSPQAQHADGDRILYVFGCTLEGCGQEEGSWRALSHHMRGQTTESSTLQAISDATPKEGASNAEGDGTHLEWDAPDQKESWEGNSTRGQPWVADSSDDWGFDQSQGRLETSTAKEGASMSLEELSAALEGLTTSSSKVLKITLTGVSTRKVQSQIVLACTQAFHFKHISVFTCCGRN